MEHVTGLGAGLDGAEFSLATSAAVREAAVGPKTLLAREVQAALACLVLVAGTVASLGMVLSLPRRRA